MLNSPVVLYVGSRGVAAPGNLLAVAVFTRIAVPAEYGHYLLIFARSMIVYGFATQCIRFVAAAQVADGIAGASAIAIKAVLFMLCGGLAIYRFGLLRTDTSNDTMAETRPMVATERTALR